MILHDFQRGRLPYFVPPPTSETDSDKTEENKMDTETVQQVEQNFETLNVVPEFEGEDLNKNMNKLLTDTAKEKSQDIQIDNDINISDSENDTIDEDECNYGDNKTSDKNSSKELNSDDLIDSQLLETLSAEEKKFLRIKESSHSKGMNIYCKHIIES